MMNVNTMYQLVGAIQSNPQVAGKAVAAGAGLGFEDMLQQTSQKPANAGADKTPAQNSGGSNADKGAQDAQSTQGAQNTQDAQKTQNAQDSPSSQGTQNAQNSPNQQDAQNPQSLQEQQALAAALAAFPQVQLVTFDPDTAAVQTAGIETGSLPQTVVVEANIGQIYAQDNEVLPQAQNAGAQVQTVAGAGEQTVFLPQEQAAVQAQPDAQQQTVAQAQPTDLAAPQTQLNSGQQPELKTAAGHENVLAGQQAQVEESSEDAAAAAQTPIFGDAEAVPVKVKEAEQTLEPEADDAAEQLAQKINQALAQGESRVTLNLTPASLGNLTVEITRLTDGTLSVILSAVTEKAAGLLEKHSVSLQTLLLSNMPGGEVRVEVENRTPEENPQQFLNPDQQENAGKQQPDEQQNRRHTDGQAEQTSFMQQLRLGLIDLDE